MSFSVDFTSSKYDNIILICLKGRFGMQNIIIIDDMKEHIQYIQDIINTMNHQFQIQTFLDIHDVLLHMDQFPDHSIIIIDILLKNHSGIELAKELNQLHKNFQIIFISSYLEKATEVYETNHCYFVYKPESKKRLPMAIEKAIHQIIESQKVLTISLKDKTKIILLNDIMYIERIQRYSYIYTVHETIKTAQKIKDLLEQLPLQFIRTHNSYIINAYYVSEIKRTHVILNNQQPIPISRAHQLKLKKQFHEFLVEQL